VDMLGLARTRAKSVRVSFRSCEPSTEPTSIPSQQLPSCGVPNAVDPGTMTRLFQVFVNVNSTQMFDPDHININVGDKIIIRVCRQDSSNKISFLGICLLEQRCRTWSLYRTFLSVPSILGKTWTDFMLLLTIVRCILRLFLITIV
jgi:hypothetical protein